MRRPQERAIFSGKVRVGSSLPSKKAIDNPLSLPRANGFVVCSCLHLLLLPLHIVPSSLGNLNTAVTRSHNSEDLVLRPRRWALVTARPADLLELAPDETRPDGELSSVFSIPSHPSRVMSIDLQSPDHPEAPLLARECKLLKSPLSRRQATAPSLVPPLASSDARSKHPSSRPRRRHQLHKQHHNSKSNSNNRRSMASAKATTISLEDYAALPPSIQ